MPSLQDHVLLAVFDGHGGVGAANFAEQHLVEVIEDTSQWKQYLRDQNIETLGEALIAAFLELDRLLRMHQKAVGNDSSGCTAVACMVTPKYYVCANAGDSRCVLGTNDDTTPLSADHKPDDPEESARITAAGGCVYW
jgi:protein phosphatase PTC2/3